MSVLVVAALMLVATPLSIAIRANSSDSAQDNEGLVSVRGVVTAFLYNNDDENETCDHDDFDDENETDDQNDTDDLTGDPQEDGFEDAIIMSLNGHGGKAPHITAFVIDNKTIVTFAPWWYWAATSPNITSLVHVGDTVNVTGEMEEEDGQQVLRAFRIDNITTGQNITIKEEGRPPWAGGPRALDY